MPTENCAIILAAGEGKRMKSCHPKVLSPVLFKPMLQWVLDAVSLSGIGHVCVVTGHLHEEVERYLEGSSFPSVEHVFQSERRGTGHAVMTTDVFLRRFSGGNVLILNGDAPFIDEQTINGALAEHEKAGNSVTVISAKVDEPTGYGRIIREKETGRLCAITEQKDANEEILQIKEINSGAYWFRTDDLLSVLYKIQNHNTQGEYYLPDAVKLLLNGNHSAGAFVATEESVVLGANDCLQLWELNEIARNRILDHLMIEGTEIPCRDGIVIGPDVTVDSGVCILPGTILRGKSTIGQNCIIGPNSLIDNSFVGENCVLNSVQCFRYNVADGHSPAPFSILPNNANLA